MADGTPDANPVFGLEQHGFDHIPEAERTMTLRDLAYFWVGANAYLFFFTVGVIAFGLGLTVGRRSSRCSSATPCSATSAGRRSRACAPGCRP